MVRNEPAPAGRLISYCGYGDVLPLRGRRKANALPRDPKTVIVCLFPYHVGAYPHRNVARYALVNDYHKICGGMLADLAAQLKAAFPLDEFVPFVDDSPICEVRAAYAAGLGAVGRHGMLIHETYGSRVFIGTIVTSLSLVPKPRAAQSCLGCGKCAAACPTGALAADRPFRRALCRSAITQKKSALTAWEQEQVKAGGLVWGCDLCADACPLNECAEATPLAAFYENIVPVLTRDNLDEALADKPYNWRGAEVLLRNLALLEDHCGDFETRTIRRIRGVL